MLIPQGDYDRPDLAPAWLPIEDSAGRPLKPIIRCQCGRLAGLRLHRVHADGRVTASFAHPPEGWAGDGQPGCGFHEYLELEGYAGPEFPLEPPMREAELYPPFESLPRPCPRCGWVALLRGGRCPDCRDVFLDTVVNRAFCDLIHGASPARAADRLKKQLDQQAAGWAGAA